MPKKKRRGGPIPFLEDPVTVAVRLDRSVQQRLVEQAKTEGVNVASVVRRAVRVYLGRSGAHEKKR